MTKTWIIFQIDNQNVYQIEYHGCEGQDLINNYKDMLAGEYKVPAEAVKVSFNDEELKTEAEPQTISSEFARRLKGQLATPEMRN